MPRSDGDLRRDFLATRDVACTSCEYNLRGLTGANCPECGHAVGLDVRRDEAAVKWRRWLAPAFAWPVLILVMYFLNWVMAFAQMAGPGSMRAIEMVQILTTVWAWAAGLVGIAALVMLVVRRGRPASVGARRWYLIIAWVLVGGMFASSLLWHLAFWL